MWINSKNILTLEDLEKFRKQNVWLINIVITIILAFIIIVSVIGSQYCTIINIWSLICCFFVGFIPGFIPYTINRTWLHIIISLSIFLLICGNLFLFHQLLQLATFEISDDQALIFFMTISLTGTYITGFFYSKTIEIIRKKLFEIYIPYEYKKPIDKNDTFVLEAYQNKCPMYTGYANSSNVGTYFQGNYNNHEFSLYDCEITRHHSVNSRQRVIDIKFEGILLIANMNFKKDIPKNLYNNVFVDIDELYYWFPNKNTYFEVSLYKPIYYSESNVKEYSKKLQEVLSIIDEYTQYEL